MQEFRTEILAVNKKGRRFFFTIALALAVIAIALVITGLIPVMVQLLWIAAFVFTTAKYYLQTRKQVLKRSVGELIIGRECITVSGEQYPVGELTSLAISFYGWKSYKRPEERSVPVTEMHAGDKNFISFVHKGRDIKLEFLLSSFEQWQLLRAHVIDWYRRGINVTETSQGSRSYGLELLNYAHVQEFKKLITNPQATE